MGFVKEFKEFAIKGSVIDLAVGVIIGAAFKTIVDSIVSDLVMPVAGIFFHADFSNLYIPLSDKIDPSLHLPLAKARELGPVFAWGNFISVVSNFAILAFIIFLMVKAINAMRRKDEAAVAAAPPPVPAPTTTEQLLTEIRDTLKNKA